MPAHQLVRVRGTASPKANTEFGTSPDGSWVFAARRPVVLAGGATTTAAEWSAWQALASRWVSRSATVMDCRYSMTRE